MVGRKGKDTPNTKDRGDKAATRAPLIGYQAIHVRRGIAITNYMAQDRPNLSVTARVLSQHLATPTEGTEMSLKRAIRYLSTHLRRC